MTDAESQQGERKVSSITGHRRQTNHCQLGLSFHACWGVCSPKLFKKSQKNKYKKKAIANVSESMANIETLPAARNVTSTMENTTGMHLKIRKVKIEVPCDTATLCLGTWPKELRQSHQEISLLPWSL